MLKKLLVSALVVVVLFATGASAYNVMLTRAAEKEAETTDAVEFTTLSAESGKNDRSGTGQGRQNEAAPSIQPTQTPGDEPPASPQASSPWQGGSDSFSADEPGSGQGNQYGKRQDQNQGQGQGHGRRRGAGNENGASQAAPDPQNGFQDWITVQGIVADYIAPNFTLLADDGLSIPVQLGNLSYTETIGLSLQNGERVSVTGFYDLDGGFSVGQITLESSGQTFALRDNLGRPLWSGGSSNW